jgi:hypothetical protein
MGIPLPHSQYVAGGRFVAKSFYFGDLGNPSLPFITIYSTAIFFIAFHPPGATPASQGLKDLRESSQAPPIQVCHSEAERGICFSSGFLDPRLSAFIRGKVVSFPAMSCDDGDLGDTLTMPHAVRGSKKSKVYSGPSERLEV